MSKVVIIDYGLGNVQSIFNAFVEIGAEVTITNDKNEILNASHCVLPGVGAFAIGMQKLANSNLIETLHRFAASGKPMLGICLGMQVLFEEGHEFGVTPGLGLIEGKVSKLDVSEKYKLPHVSWNELIKPNNCDWDNSILSEVKEDQNFYFVHSYAVQPNNENDILSLTKYGNVTFCSSVRKGNVFGVQFHPEKSGKVGLQLLRYFINFK